MIKIIILYGLYSPLRLIKAFRAFNEIEIVMFVVFLFAFELAVLIPNVLRVPMRMTWTETFAKREEVVDIVQLATNARSAVMELTTLVDLHVEPRRKAKHAFNRPKLCNDFDLQSRNFSSCLKSFFSYSFTNPPLILT